MSEQNEIVNTAPSEVDTAAADFIKQMEAEVRAEDLKVEAPEDKASAGAPVEGVQTEAKAEPPPAGLPVPGGTSQAPGKSQEEIIAEAVTRALLASRQAEEEERAARARQTEESATNSAPEDELELLRRMGLDPDYVVRRVLAQKLGDKAPEDLRKAIAEQELRNKMTALEGKIIQQQRELAARQYQDQISEGAKAYLGGDFSKDAPTVAEVVKRDPVRVHAEVMQEIISDARARASHEPNGQPLTYAEAVGRVEKRWAEYRGLFSQPQPSASTTTTAPTQATEQAKTTPKVVKAPDRPLAPWQQRGPIEEEGLRLAIDEFKRSESGRG